MKTPLLLVSFLVLLTGVTSPLCVRAADPDDYVAVAWYANRPEAAEGDGKRAAAILAERKIRGVAVGSASMTMSVPRRQAEEAREILREAIEKEHLSIHVIEKDA